MPHPRLLATTALVLALVSLPTTAHAQVRCGYDECALRVERNHLVSGTAGNPVLRLGPHTDVMRRLDWRSERAREYVSMYEGGHSLASNLRLVGFVADVASAVMTWQVYRDYRRQANEVNEQQDAGGPVTTRIDLQNTKLAIAGGLSVAALVTRWSARRFDAIARAHLERAVWWHNREIARD